MFGLMVGFNVNSTTGKKNKKRKKKETKRRRISNLLSHSLWAQMFYIFSPPLFAIYTLRMT